MTRLITRLTTLIPLLGMWGLCLLAGWVISGVSGALVVLSVTLAGAVFLPRLSIRMVMKFMKARPLDPRNVPGLHAYLVKIADRAGLENIPDLYLITGPPNAFSSGGSKRSGLAISDSLLRTLRPEETVAVLAHEIAHIKHGDVAISRFAELLNRTGRLLAVAGLLIALITIMLGERVTSPAWGLWILAFMPLVLTMLQLAQARRREYLADATAARWIGKPIYMARALHKIEHGQLSGFQRLIGNITRNRDIPPWLRTHPPTRQRIERLMAMEGAHNT